jgi:hypothetical protein
MEKLKLGLGVAALIVAAAFAHYFLPSHDVVRIVGTDIARVDATSRDSEGREVARTRDVRYINAATPDGEPRVYRNEDTGWGWPPYFKFDSANLAARADSVVSTSDDPRWMIVTHYGWRLPIFSVFPNAVAIDPASGPDDAPFPWLNIVIIVLVALTLAVARRFILMALR